MLLGRDDLLDLALEGAGKAPKGFWYVRDFVRLAVGDDAVWFAVWFAQDKAVLSWVGLHFKRQRPDNLRAGLKDHQGVQIWIVLDTTGNK